MKACLGVLLLASVASAEAIVIRGHYEFPRENQPPRYVGLDGYALLADDGRTVTGGRLAFIGGWYWMKVTGGTWDGEIYENGPTISTGDLNLEGFGCRLSEPFMCRNPDQYEMTVENWDFTYHHNMVSEGAITAVGSYYTVSIGDANLDGVFDSGDLVSVFTSGEYDDNTVCWINEHGVESCQLNDPSWIANSGWSEGDWNGDMDFDSGDLVFAFQEGAYQGSTPIVPEPTALVLTLLGVVVAMTRR